MALYIVTFRPKSSSVNDLEEDFAHESLNQALWKMDDGVKRRVQGLCLVVTGHCSDSEDDSLAMRRAKALGDRFAANGVSGDYLRCRAHDPCDVAKSRNLNRSSTAASRSGSPACPIATRLPARASISRASCGSLANQNAAQHGLQPTAADEIMSRRG